MENASKALIIAGSIILSILIITLGMYFYSQSAGLGKNFNMTEYDIQAHNSTFQGYEGKISGAEARELYDIIYQYNISAGDDKLGVRLNIDKAPTAQNENAGTGTSCMSSMLAAKKSNLNIGKFYNVTMIKDSKLGVISAIYIVELK